MENQTAQQKDKPRSSMINVACNPSLKKAVEDRLPAAGFRSMARFVDSVFQAFVDGRINYISGQWSCPVNNCPN